jgi:integrase
VRLAIRTRHYSPRTEETYVGWIKRFIFFHNKRHPAEMGEQEIARFLSSLASESHVSASTQNQALNAILFLYREVLRKIGYVNGVVRAKRPKRLPVVLTRQEVRSIVDLLSGPGWIMEMLLYGAGLRLIECLRLRVKDVDFSRAEIRVRSGKGDKDRVTMLPAAVKEPLRRHLELVKKQYETDLKSGYSGVSPGCFGTEVPECQQSTELAMGVPGFKPLHRSPVRAEKEAPSPRIGVAEGGQRGRAEGRNFQAGKPAHVSSLLCDPPAGGRVMTSGRSKSCLVIGM